MILVGAVADFGTTESDREQAAQQGTRVQMCSKGAVKGAGWFVLAACCLGVCEAKAPELSDPAASIQHSWRGHTPHSWNLIDPSTTQVQGHQKTSD